MKEILTTAKMPPDTLQMIRLISAKTGERQYEVLRRLLKAEMKQLFGKETI
jgi:hypothetical protein